MARTDEILSKLFEEHYPSLLRYVMAQIHDRDDAEEIVSDTFFRLMQIWGSRIDMDETANIKWLYAAAKNVLMETWRKKKKAPVALPPHYEDIPYHDHAIEQIMEHDEAKSYLLQIRAHLSDEEFSLMKAFILSDGDYAAYAQANNMNPGTLRSKVSRLRKKLLQLGQEWKK